MKPVVADGLLISMGGRYDVIVQTKLEGRPAADARLSAVGKTNGRRPSTRSWGNNTELPISEHTTDSHGLTLATFALFDLVGLRLSPASPSSTRSSSGGPAPPATTSGGPRPGPLLGQHAQVDLIAEHWTDQVHIGGSPPPASKPATPTGP